MNQTNYQDIIIGFSMFPGLLLCIIWWDVMFYPAYIAVLGYVVTCCCSTLFHITSGLGYENPNIWLRLDLIGQNIGIMCGSSQSRLGYTYPLVLLPLSVVCLLSDLEQPNEVSLAFAANAINLIMSCLFSMKVIVKWFIGFALFYWEKYHQSTLVNTSSGTL